MRPQRDAFELPSAVRLLDLHAGGAVAICYDHDTGVGAKVQVPELMTGGKRGDKQLRRIPTADIGRRGPEVAFVPDSDISYISEIHFVQTRGPRATSVCLFGW